MYIADAKRLTAAGAKKIMATAIARAQEAGIAVSVAIVDAGGHLLLLERMEGGRFHTVHSATTKAVCAASNKRITGAKGAQGQSLDVAHALGHVLADAIQRSRKMTIAACYSRSAEKREKFAAKYGCRAAASYEAILNDRSIEAIINTTPNGVHRETTLAAAAAGKHVFLDKPIANTIADARAVTDACRRAKVVLALGYQRLRESHFRWMRREIEEGGFGKIDPSSWRYTAEGMPGGVMLQIGIHYTDVLEYLLGPVEAVSGRFVRLVLPGDNPDVASLVLEHENGALSTLNASYASASEYYLLNLYGKEATAFFDFHEGLRLLRRGSEKAQKVPLKKNDPIVDELEEFARAVRGECEPEMDGERSTRSLAVILAGIRSAKEARRVEVSEVLK